MKIIFLDVDGVLNTDEDIRIYGNDYVNDSSLEFLKKIVYKTNSQIVLSSTWRIWDFSKKIIENHLYDKKILVLDSTPYMPVRFSSAWSDKSREIKRWLEPRPQVKKYAIIDDDPSAGVGFENNFFQIDSALGLTQEITDKIITYLNEV